MPLSVALADSEDFACDYSAAENDQHYVFYGSSEVITYSATEATTAGVPTGYEGEVIKVIAASNSVSKGVLLDFSAKKVPLNVVNGLKVRFYVSAATANNDTSYPQLRIHNPTSYKNWIYNPGTKITTGAWATVDIPSTGFEKLAVNGYLDKFELVVRSQGAVDWYIDSIAVIPKSNDGVAPVITCDSDTFNWVEGVPLQVDATAYDEFEDRNVDIEYVYGNDVQLDQDGNLKQGEWQVTLVAKDYFGNQSQKVITVNVKEVDKTPPVITTAPSTVYAKVGTVPLFTPKATDDNGEVTVTGTWSQGALDAKGRLTAGTHTYVITATDVSQNVATHTITVIVAADNGLGSNFIDEEVLLGGGTTGGGSSDNTGGGTTSGGSTGDSGNVGGGTTGGGSSDNTGGGTTGGGSSDNIGGGTTGGENTGGGSTGGDSSDNGNTGGGSTGGDNGNAGGGAGTADKNEGLGAGAIIAIAVGAAVVVAGGAVIIIKKKKGGKK